MWEKELECALEAGKSAISVIMDYYHNGFDVEIKSDDSPVTQADKAADKIIRKVLSKNYPTYGILSEESVDDKKRLTNDYVWIVDPLDGTKDFIAKDDEFTINIALAYKNDVVVGVVIAPATGDIYYASKGNGAYHLNGDLLEKIHVNDKLTDLTVLCSVFHLMPSDMELINKYSYKIKHMKRVGSALKACQIAEGKAELSYRMASGTKEWDTAAIQCIVFEAGGLFVKPDLSPITYNRDDVVNREGYIIVNRKENILL